MQDIKCYRDLDVWQAEMDCRWTALRSPSDSRLRTVRTDVPDSAGGGFDPVERRRRAQPRRAGQSTTRYRWNHVSIARRCELITRLEIALRLELLTVCDCSCRLDVGSSLALRTGLG